MLLDNFLKPGIIQLRELRQIMHIGDNIAQILLQHLKVLFRRRILLLSLLQTFDNILHFLLRHLYTTHDLARLDFLEREDLVELGLKNTHKRLLVFFRPLAVL